ncbi:MAG: thiol reductant ABC exporter subunit CydC [Actinomycetota bacterium]|nr:thiol reductant ABC exporter subunit CydC [Actinomycetota bacterium]
MSGFRRLVESLRAHPARLAASIGAGAAAIASSIGLLTVSAYLISAAALHPPLLDLTVAIVGVRFFGLSRAVFRYLERLGSHELSLRLLGDLRTRMARAIYRLGPAGVASFRAGDLVGRVLDDVDEIQHVFVRVITPPLVAIVIVVLTALMALVWLPASVITILVPLLIAALGVPWLTRRAGNAAGRTTADDRGRLIGQTVEIIEGAAVIVALGAEEQLLSTANEAAKRVAVAERRTAWLHGFGDAAILLLIGLALVGTLWVSALAVGSGSLDGVMVAVLAMLAITPFEAVAPLPSAFERLGRSLGAADRLFGVIDAEPPVVRSDHPLAIPADPIIKVEGVVVDAAPDERILGPIDLEITPGIRIGIVGETGAGKTTLAHILCRFRDPTGGAVTVGGVDLRDTANDELRALIGYEDDRAFLFRGTVVGNVRIGNDEASDEDVRAVLERVNLGVWIDSLPEGTQTDVGEGGGFVSGGQRRRLALARALLADFPVLILDEPISGLDPETAEIVMDDLLDAAHDRALVLITHRPVGLDLMDEIIVLEEGVIADRGTHDQLLTTSERYRGMWALAGGSP